MSIIRTVRGDIAPSELGPCDAHEHLFLETPIQPGDGFTDAAKAIEEARTLAAAGAASPARRSGAAEVLAGLDHPRADRGARRARLRRSPPRGRRHGAALVLAGLRRGGRGRLPVFALQTPGSGG